MAVAHMMLRDGLEWEQYKVMDRLTKAMQINVKNEKNYCDVGINVSNIRIKSDGLKSN